MKRYLNDLLAVLMAGCALSSCNHSTSPSYAGTYLDQDINEPNLVISPREDGKFDVSIGIYRLTSLDDGIGAASDNGLSFTATDANGNPIRGIITLDGDTATVTFTDSKWPLLVNGSSFTYTRQSDEQALLYRVRSMYADVAYRPFEGAALTQEYCTSDWKETEAKVIAKDESTPDQIGFFDTNYWIQGQDCGSLDISDLAVESLSGDNAAVTFTLHNLGTATPMRLLLKKEDGEWKVDNFITLNQPVIDWKASMKDYLKHN